MSLSEKIKGYDPMTQLVVTGDVKEFIRKVEKRLKKEIDFPSRGLCVPSLQIIKRIITRVLKEEAGKELLE